MGHTPPLATAWQCLPVPGSACRQSAGGGAPAARPMASGDHVQVCVAEGGGLRRGVLFARDPATGMLVLLTLCGPAHAAHERLDVELIPAHAVIEMRVEAVKADKAAEGRALVARFALTLQQRDARLEQPSIATPAVLATRQQAVRVYLEGFHLPVDCQGDQLHVLETLTVRPPYDAAACSSTNTIVLQRVQALLAAMPDCPLASAEA